MGVQAGVIPATGTTTITGLGGRPRCILFLGTNQSVYESAFVATQGGGFFGWAVEQEDETIANFCTFAILTTGRCSNLTTNCARAMTSSGSVTNLGLLLYEADVTEITDSSFTITFSTGSGAHQIHYLAIWGITPAVVFPYEANCDGDPYVTDVGQTTAVMLALGQWRDTCHTFPKSTSTSLWHAKQWGDLSYYATCWDTAAQSVISGLWSSGAFSGPFGTEMVLGGTADPFVFGSIFSGVTHVGRTATPTEMRFNVTGGGGGYDWIIASFGECFLGNVDETSSGGGAIGTEAICNVPDRTSGLEAVIFNNFQYSSEGAALGADKVWGAGFATPDYQCGYSISEANGSFYQSASNSWVSRTNGAPAASAGTVDFTPTSGDFSLITQLNAAGDGAVGWMAIQTYCPEEELLQVALDPLNTSRFIGTWSEARGGVPEGIPIV